MSALRGMPSALIRGGHESECFCLVVVFFFFFQAEDGIRDLTVTGVQTCALPIFARRGALGLAPALRGAPAVCYRPRVMGDSVTLAREGAIATVTLNRPDRRRSEEHTSELQSQSNLVCRLLLEKKKKLRRVL